MRQRMMVVNGIINGITFGKDQAGAAHESSRKKSRLTLSDILHQVLPTTWSARRSRLHSSQQSDSSLSSSPSVRGELSEEDKIRLYNRQFDRYS